MAHHLRVAGSRACFRRPELRQDFVTYDAITPLAASRIFAAIHSTPAIRWLIERIVVTKPIQTGWDALAAPERKICYLTDVDYVITASFELTELASAADNPKRHAATFRRRAVRGQSAYPIHLGLMHYPGSFSLIDTDELDLSLNAAGHSADLGWMIYDTDGSPNARARYFRASIDEGIIHVPRPDHPSLVS